MALSTTAQRDFRIQRSTGAVPGTVWTPEAPAAPGDSAGAPGLVLLGHGGSGHRHSARILALAAEFTRRGLAAAAIDGPFHGERLARPLTVAEYQGRISAEGIGTVLDRMTEDWVATRDLLAEEGVADRSRVAYLGLSMGARYGLGAAAALGPDLRCAVFGKFGTQALGPDPGMQAPERALEDASLISAPVLFHMQWDDEIFPRAGQFELFDAFAGPDKELRAYVGGHGRTPEHAPGYWCDFISGHMV